VGNPEILTFVRKLLDLAAEYQRRLHERERKNGKEKEK
jgi:hypothetical protein